QAHARSRGSAASDRKFRTAHGKRATGSVPNKRSWMPTNSPNGFSPDPSDMACCHWNFNGAKSYRKLNTSTGTANRNDTTPWSRYPGSHSRKRRPARRKLKNPAGTARAIVYLPSAPPPSNTPPTTHSQTEMLSLSNRRWTTTSQPRYADQNRSSGVSGVTRTAPNVNSGVAATHGSSRRGRLSQAI